MTLIEKAAYLKGLAEGLSISDETKEGKIINGLLDLVGEMAQNLTDVNDDLDQVYDELDAIDEDITDIEDYLWEDEEFEEDDDCDCGCDSCEEIDEIYEITCPNCGETTCVTEDMLASDDLACPACGTSFEVDFDACDAGIEE